MYPLRAPTASPPIITPSITACGSCSKISRSLHVPGSLSSPLHSTYFRSEDLSAARPHRQPADHYPFDHRVRIMLENQPVFARAGFALVAVAQHILRLGRLLGHERDRKSTRLNSSHLGISYAVF